MRHAGNVFDRFDGDVQSGQHADGGVAAQADALDQYLGFVKAVLLLSGLGGALGGDLGGVGSALFGAAEAAGAGAAGGKDVALAIGKSDNRVIEGGQHVDL